MTAPILFFNLTKGLMESFNSVITFLVSLTVFPFLINSLFIFFFKAPSVAFKTISVPLLLMAFYLCFKGAVSSDTRNGMIFPTDPESMRRPKIKTKG